MIYFDNAASSFPKPRGVAKAISKAVRSYGANPGRSGHALAMRAAEKIYECRQRAAELFGMAEPERVIFTQNATAALNLVLKGIMSGGGHAVTSDLEHNSVRRPLLAMADAGVDVTEARVDFYDDDATLRSFEDALRPDTRLIAVTHASNVWGNVLPVRALCALAKGRGIPLVLDASQTAGKLDISMADGYAAVCTAGHKGLYGPQGTGLLLLAQGLYLPTLTEGGSGAASLDPGQPEDPPERYEAGTLNTPGIAGLFEGLGYVMDNSAEEIGLFERELCLHLFTELSRMTGVRLYTPVTARSAGLLSFNIEGMASEKVAAALDRAGFCVRGGLHCAPSAHRRMDTLKSGAVRVSFGAFNTHRQVDALLRAVYKLAVGG